MTIAGRTLGILFSGGVALAFAGFALFMANISGGSARTRFTLTGIVIFAAGCLMLLAGVVLSLVMIAKAIFRRTRA